MQQLLLHSSLVSGGRAAHQDGKLQLQQHPSQGGYSANMPPVLRGAQQQHSHSPIPPQPNSPDSATSAIGTPCSFAMKPRMEKMAKPATKLVPLLRKQRATQSLGEAGTASARWGSSYNSHPLATPKVTPALPPQPLCPQQVFTSSIPTAQPSTSRMPQSGQHKRILAKESLR